MNNPLYQLPTIEFIGGETTTIVFNLWALSPTESANKSLPYNANGCTVTFSLIDSINKTGEPLLSKKCTLLSEADGTSPRASVTIEPEETINQAGRYIYQLTVQSSTGETEIPGQGIAFINLNIDRALVSGAARMMRIN